MHINTAILGQQIAHKHQPFIDHSDKGVRPLAPGIAVRDLFEDVGLLGKRVAVAYLNIHRKVGPDIERWVDIDQLEAAPFLDFLAQRPVLER